MALGVEMVVWELSLVFFPARAVLGAHAERVFPAERSRIPKITDVFWIVFPVTTWWSWVRDEDSAARQVHEKDDGEQS